jgi:hypothetical protein
LSSWIERCESILPTLGLPFDFERFEGNTKQLPDTYIVYFLVDDVGAAWADNKETAKKPRFQVSLFYREKAVFLTVPEQIEAAFKNAGFMRVGSGRIPYSAETGHYGWRCDFRTIERRD